MSAIKSFKHLHCDDVVQGFLYTGADMIEAVKELSGLHVHDIYAIDPKNTNAVTCAVSVPVGDTGCYTPIVLVPGCYFYKDCLGELHVCPKHLFDVNYWEEEEKENGEHLDFD